MNDNDNNLQDALTSAGEAAARAARAFGDMLCALSKAVAIYSNNVTTPMLWLILKEGDRASAILDQAPPRVRHLALHGKKRRTRKKNLNRARKLYRHNRGGAKE